MRDRLLEGRLSVNIISLLWRFSQCIVAVAVIGLYAQDLNKNNKDNKYYNYAKWVVTSPPQLLPPPSQSPPPTNQPPRSTQ
jgi:hypothetical protein